MRPRFRFAIGVAILAGLGHSLSPSPALAHPGQRLDVRITIDDQRVSLQVLVSADMLVALLRENSLVMDLPRREGGKYLFPSDESEQHAKAVIRSLFEDQNPVEVDGRLVRCALDSLEFVRPQYWIGDIRLPPDLLLVMSSPASETPRQVALTWTMFPRDSSRAPFGLAPAWDVVAQLRTPHEDRIIVFSENEPQFIWHAAAEGLRRQGEVVTAAERPLLAIPLLSLGIGAGWLVVILGLRRSHRRPWAGRLAPLLTVLVLGVAVLLNGVWNVRVAAPWRPAIEPPPADEAMAIFRSLHRNVYEAFEQREENGVYDVLARSVDGRLLDEVYNEVHQGLILRDQGGAVARIKGVEIMEASMEAPGRLDSARDGAFSVRGRWRVHGIVYHWGHVHSRTNEYNAVFTIGQRDGNWRITAIGDMEQQRIPQPGDDPEFARRDAPGA